MIDLLIEWLINCLDNVGVLEDGSVQAANLRVPGAHVRGLQYYLSATVHGVM